MSSVKNQEDDTLRIIGIVNENETKLQWCHLLHFEDQKRVAGTKWAVAGFFIF